MARICKVLVVEDNDDVRELFKDVLADQGYHFFTACNGEEMRAVIAVQPDIDAFIIDVALPGAQDGLALAHEMASCGHAVLLVTADHRLVARIEQSGHRYLLKPFKLASLLDLVDQVLRELADGCARLPRRA